MKKIVLVCAAHPDDEALGCGATMARHAASGDDVHVLLLGKGIASRDAADEDRGPEQERLRAAAQAACETLGAASLTMHDFPDNAMDTVARLDLAKAVEKAIASLNPGIIYTHHQNDLNVDHVRVHEAVAVAARPVPGQSVSAIYCFEVPSSSGWRPGASFTPNYFVDVSRTLALKLTALRCYEQEMRPWPHARSLEATEHLARWRGAMVGVEAAEAFTIARLVQHEEEK